MIKKGDNIRLWDQEVLADAIILYTQLALQLANLTSTNRAALVQTPVVKRAPTGNRRGRPKATEVIARTNHTMDEFFWKKPCPGAREFYIIFSLTYLLTYLLTQY